MSHRRLRIKRNARVQCLSAFYAFSVKFSVSEFFDTGSNLENYCYKSRRKIRIKRRNPEFTERETEIFSATTTIIRLIRRCQNAKCYNDMDKTAKKHDGRCIKRNARVQC